MTCVDLKFRLGLLQDQRRVPRGEAVRPENIGHAGCGWLWTRRTGADPEQCRALVRTEEDEEGADRGDSPTAAHHVREGDHG